MAKNQSEVAHNWAHELKDSDNYQNRLWFSGSRIYSFDAEIGRIIRNRRGDKAYVLTPRCFTQTTERHKKIVRDAIPVYATVFNTCGHLPAADNGINLYHDRAVKHVFAHCKDIVALMSKQWNARTKDYVEAIKCKCQEIHDWIAFWELDMVQTWNDKPQQSIFDKIDDSAKQLGYGRTEAMCFKLLARFGLLKEPMSYDARNLVISALQAWFGESRVDEEIAKFADEMKAAKEKMRMMAVKEEERDYKNDCTKLEEWREHKTDAFLPTEAFKKRTGWRTALRLTDGYIETSQCIRLPMNEGKRLWQIIKAFENGAEFRREIAVDLQGTKWKLDNYKNHVLTAGCHTIPFSECKQIATQMGW